MCIDEDEEALSVMLAMLAKLRQLPKLRCLQLSQCTSVPFATVSAQDALRLVHELCAMTKLQVLRLEWVALGEATVEFAAAMHLTGLTLTHCDVLDPTKDLLVGALGTRVQFD